MPRRDIAATHVFYWLLVISANINKGLLLQMLTESKKLTVKVGETVSLQCEFFYDSFSLFENPFLWRKTQRVEETQINMMGNLMEPFASSTRFRITFQPFRPRYLITLHINIVTLEDNGNYTCEISGPHNFLLGNVTHYIFVRAPVDNLYLVNSIPVALTTSSSNISTAYRHPPLLLTPSKPRLLYTESTPGSLGCVTLGGSPPPELSVFLDGRDITRRFAPTRSARMTGVWGLRLLYYKTELWRDELVVNASEDNMNVTCTATVPGMVTNTTSVRLTVHYAAMIRCDEATSFLGDRNVFMRCEVRANPRLSALFWIIDTNGTTVSEGQVVNDYWTLVMEHDSNDDMVESQLFLRLTTAQSFRKYTLVAENDVGTRTKDVSLVQKFYTVPKVETLNQLKTGYPSKQSSLDRGQMMTSGSSCVIWVSDVRLCYQRGFVWRTLLMFLLFIFVSIIR